MISTVTDLLPIANAIKIGEPSIVMMHLSVSYISEADTISQERMLVAGLPIISTNDMSSLNASNFVNCITETTSIFDIANYVMREKAPEFTKLKHVRTGADEDDWFSIPIHENNLKILNVGILKTQGILSNFLCKDLYIELEIVKDHETMSNR